MLKSFDVLDVDVLFILLAGTGTLIHHTEGRGLLAISILTSLKEPLVGKKIHCTCQKNKKPMKEDGFPDTDGSPAENTRGNCPIGFNLIPKQKSIITPTQPTTRQLENNKNVILYLTPKIRAACTLRIPTHPLVIAFVRLTIGGLLRTAPLLKALVLPVTILLRKPSNLRSIPVPR
jgi:hypothetical protein